MAQQILDLGSGPDTKDGDKLRPAMAKIQANFDDLYSRQLFADAADGGIADNTAIINAALSIAGSTGSGGRRGDIVDLRAGSFGCKGVILPDATILRGKGQRQTNLANTAPNDAGFVVESADFDSLYGTNAWFRSEGVPTFYGVEKLAIYGGRRPPTMATEDRGGLRLYAKSLLLNDLMIFNTDGVGLLTVCGDQVGQTDEWDMPEGSSNNIKIKRTGGHGWVHRGPHDGVVNNVAIAEAGFAEVGGPTGSIYGLWIDYSPGQYVGHGEFNRFHIYGTKGVGAKIDRVIHSDAFISESNTHQDLIFGATAQNCYIGWLQTYGSDLAAGTLPSVVIEDGAQNIVLRKWQSTGSPAAQHGLLSGGRNCEIGVNCRYGSGKTGYGVKDTGTNNEIVGHIEGFSGVGGVGLHLDGAQYGRYAGTIRNCSTAIKMEGDIRGITIDVVVQLVSGQDVFDGPTISLLAGFDDVARRSCSIRIRGRRASDSITSHAQLLSAPLDVSTTGLKTIAVAHTLVMTPNQRDIQVSMTYNGGTSPAWELGDWGVLSVDATNITLQYDVKVADVAASPPPRFNIDARIPGGA